MNITDTRASVCGKFRQNLGFWFGQGIWPGVQAKQGRLDRLISHGETGKELMMSADTTKVFLHQERSRKIFSAASSTTKGTKKPSSLEWKLTHED